MKNSRVENEDEDHRPAAPRVAQPVYLSKGHKAFEKYQRARVLHPRFDGRTWSSLTSEERRPFEED